MPKKPNQLTHLYLPWSSALLRSIIAISLVVLIQSCGSTGARQPSVDDTLSDAQRWENLANRSTGEQRAVYQLSAAEAWYLSLEVERAMFTLVAIDPVYLPSNELIDYSLLYAEVLVLQGRHQAALQVLQEPLKQSRLMEALPEKQAAWAERSGNIHLVLGEFNFAARYFDYALSLDGDLALLERLRESLWRSLIRAEELPEPPFQSAEMPGWIALANVNNSSDGILVNQLGEYQQWRRVFLTHPAALNPPESIEVLESLATEPPPKVALLLPLTGNLAAAGNAVLEGYLATVVSNRGKDPLNPSEVLVFDTNSQSISAIVNELRSLQVNHVIGPLEKDKVSAFTILAEPDMRALTLNSIENDVLTRDKLILGLALDIENEAQEAATAALRDGHRTALALVPNNSSGDRASEAFVEAWVEQNGVVAGVDRFQANDTFANLLGSRLHIDQSESRMAELRRLLATNMEFTPRRREDIEALFLTATPAQARQIKPMLAFYYADDIPVYSTSTIYDGDEDTKANQDLDDIRFSTLPWLLSESDLHETLANSSQYSGSLLKLQAMGVDAYYLSQRIPQFVVAGNAVYHGVVGTLSLQPGERNLDRQQIWAEFTGGRVEALP